jgi:hypothetical protein
MPRLVLDQNALVGDFHLAAHPDALVGGFMTPLEVDRAKGVVGRAI